MVFSLAPFGTSKAIKDMQLDTACTAELVMLAITHYHSKNEITFYNGKSEREATIDDVIMDICDDVDEYYLSRFHYGDKNW